MPEYEPRETTTSASAAPARANETTATTSRAELRGMSYEAGTTALSPAGAANQVTVRGGDTLSALAARHLGDAGQWRQLWEANRGAIPNPNLIRPGQVLVLPGQSGPSPTGSAGAAPAPTTQPPAGGFNVTVAAGDTLSGLAGRHLGDASAWRILWDANRAALPNPNLLRVGQTLVIPGRSAPAPTPAPAQPTPAPAQPAPQPDTSDHTIYTVQPLDTLTWIAKKTLGDSTRWREIWDLNKDQVSEPGLIHPGMKLKIPRNAGAPVTTTPGQAAPGTITPTPGGRAEGRTPTERAMAKLYNEKGTFIAQQASNLGIEPSVAAAVLMAESSGTGYGSDGRLKIRFETHIFKGYTNRTVSNSHRNQTAEYDAFARAREIDETAAFKSISMGAAQIMGFNAESVGYENASQMFDAFAASEEAQLMGMFEFVRGRPVLVRAAKNKDWETFARHYNGPAYKRYAYDIKLANYYQAYRTVTANL